MRTMAKVIVKNDGVEFEVPDGSYLLPYLWERTSMPRGCEDGSTTICACVILRGEENLNGKTDVEIATLNKAGAPNSPRNRLACQLYIMKGEVEIEY